MVGRSLLKAWEIMLEPGTEEKKEFLRRREEIEKEKNDKLRLWEQEKESYDTLAKYDNEGKDLIIEIEYLWRLLEICEQITERYGLRND